MENLIAAVDHIVHNFDMTKQYRLLGSYSNIHKIRNLPLNIRVEPNPYATDKFLYLFQGLNFVATLQLKDAFQEFKEREE